MKVLTNFLMGLVWEAIPIEVALKVARKTPAKTSKMEVGSKLHLPHVNIGRRGIRWKVAGVERGDGIVLTMKMVMMEVVMVEMVMVEMVLVVMVMVEMVMVEVVMVEMVMVEMVMVDMVMVEMVMVER